MKLVLIGGGGHCKSILDCVRRIDKKADVLIVDPAIPEGSVIMGAGAAGGDKMLGELYEKGYRNAFISTGSIKSTALRRKLYKKAADIGYDFPVIADPSAVVSEYAVIGQGAFIGKNAVINADSHIGSHAIINTGSIIEHECVIREFSHVAVGARLCGQVRIGSDSFIGAGTTVIQGIKIGDQAIIGAGSVVLRDVKDGEKVWGLVR